MSSGSQRHRHPPAALKPPKPKQAEVCPKTGKRSYLERGDAVGAAAGFSRRRKFKGVRIYRCEFCRHWHLTSNLRVKKR